MNVQSMSPWTVVVVATMESLNFVTDYLQIYRVGLA